MQISNVVLSNIGPHKYLSVDFASGLTGIVGANGSGKSTLVNAIYAALTGDFSRLGSTKADAIHNDGEGSSYIELHGSHNNQPFRVYRGLKPNKTVIQFGDEQVKSTRAANEELLAQLNVPKAVIDNYVFVNQWGMFGFLDQRESERAKILQYICRTEHADAIHKACNAFVSKYASTNVLDNSLELIATIEQQEKQMQSIARDGKQASDRILPDDTVAELKMFQQAYADQEKLAKDLTEERDRLAASKEDEARHDATVSSLTAELEVEVAKLTKLRAEADRAKQVLDQLKPAIEMRRQYKQAAEAVEHARADKDNAAKRLLECQNACGDIEAKNSLQEVEAAISSYSALQIKMEYDRDDLQSMIDHLSQDLDDKKCSRCGQVLTPEVRQESENQLQVLLPKISEYRSLLRRLRDVKVEFDNVHSAEQSLKRAENAYSSAATRMQMLSASVDMSIDSKELQAVIEKANALQRSVNSRKDSLATARERLAAAKARTVSIADSVERAHRQLADVKQLLESAPQRELINLRLADSEKAEKARDSAKMAFKTLRTSLAQTKELLSDLRKKLNRHKKVQHQLEVVRQVADVFHWQNLPKAVSNANLRLLTEDINRTLALFKDPFVVEPTEDLMFNAFFPGKPAVSARQLSGGQKVVLASAFRIALDRLFDVGVMFLDEPTAGLDADNVAYFHDALQVMSESLKGRKQVVVITHLHDYCDRFDAVVEL